MTKMVSNNDVLGATVTYVGWSTIEVLTADGRRLEVRVDEGHSGPELNAYEMNKSNR